MKAFFWAAGSDGSSFYRQTLPVTGLQWRGHHVTTSTQMALPALRGADAVVAARVATPEATRAWTALGQHGVPRILDLDDDYFRLDETNEKAYEFWQRADLLRNLKANMDAADLVTVASQGLADAMAEHTRTEIMVVRNLLPAQYLGAPRQYHRPGQPLTVGWAGSSSTLWELPIVARALGKLANLDRDIRVKLVGCTRDDAFKQGVAGPNVRATGWIPSVPEYLKEVMEFDIWVAPYRPTPFNLAKFPTKALEAAFLGIPLIASDTRPYRDWVMAHGSECGVQLVGNEHQWGRFLRFLTDPMGGALLREQAGHAGSSAAARHTLQSGVTIWEDAITRAKENRRG